MIVDSSALIAYFDDKDPDHGRVVEIFDAATEALTVSPYVVGEVDYLVASRQGVGVELAVLEQLAGGAWDLVAFGRDDLAEAIGLIGKYADQDIGVTDASLVVLAKRHRTRTIATLDRRHFEVLRPLDGGRFTVVP